MKKKCARSTKNGGEKKTNEQPQHGQPYICLHFFHVLHLCIGSAMLLGRSSSERRKIVFSVAANRMVITLDDSHVKKRTKKKITKTQAEHS